MIGFKLRKNNFCVFLVLSYENVGSNDSGSNNGDRDDYQGSAGCL